MKGKRWSQWLNLDFTHDISTHIHTYICMKSYIIENLIIMKQIFVVINKVQQYSFNILACRKLCLYSADCNNERKKK